MIALISMHQECNDVMMSSCVIKIISSCTLPRPSPSFSSLALAQLPVACSTSDGKLGEGLGTRLLLACTKGVFRIIRDQSLVRIAPPFTHYVALSPGSSFFAITSASWGGGPGMRLTKEGMGCLRYAFQVVTDFGGQIPRTADELMKSLPGVGRYTASMSEYIKLFYLPPLSPILFLSPPFSTLPTPPSLPPLPPLFSPILSTLLCRCNSIHCIWRAVWGGGWERGEGVLATESRGSMLRS